MMTPFGLTLTPEAYAHRLLRLGALSLRPDKPYVWASGMNSPLYCDNRLNITSPENRDFIVRFAQETINKHSLEFDGFLAIPSGGIWLAVLLAMRYKVPVVVPDGDKFIYYEIPEAKQLPDEPAERYDAIVASYPRALIQQVVYADRNHLPLLYMRPKEKAHGKGKRIEGDTRDINTVFLTYHPDDFPDNTSEQTVLKIIKDQELGLYAYNKNTYVFKTVENFSGMRLVGVEDLFSTGRSSLKEIDKARLAGATITDCIAMFDYTLKISDDAYAEAGLTKVPLLTYGKMIEVAFEQGFVPEEHRATLISWSHDPKAWSENYLALQETNS